MFNRNSTLLSIAIFLVERRNYSNAFNAIVRIAREEGFLALWRGTIPTMGRAMVVNAAQLGSYSQSKEMLLDTGLYSMSKPNIKQRVFQ